jgi:hypothetical protein
MNPIYTLGYSGWNPEALKAKAEELNALVCDIRFSPASRAPQWRQPALIALLGNRYRWLKGLGNENYRNGGAIRLHQPEASCAYIATLPPDQPLILMCACRDHHQCHRTEAARFVSDTVGGGVEVVHLYPVRRPDPLTCEKCGRAKITGRGMKRYLCYECDRGALGEAAYQVIQGILKENFLTEGDLSLRSTPTDPNVFRELWNERSKEEQDG